MNLKGYQFTNNEGRLVAYFMTKDCLLVLKEELFTSEIDKDVNDKIDEMVKTLNEKSFEVLGIVKE